MTTVAEAASVLIDGKAFAIGLRERVAAEIGGIRTRTGGVPGLAVILVGEDPASQVYVRSKARAVEEVGMNGFEHRLFETISECELLDLIASLNADEKVHGILVQLPLPGHIDSAKVLEAIDPAKDVDGFHLMNVGRLATGQDALVPCTPLGCVMLLKAHLGDLAGLTAVVVGRSNIVGKPMAQLLLRENATVTMAHAHTRDLGGLCRQADILIVAVGRPHLIGPDYVKDGATVIDVGINRIEKADGKTALTGDVEFDAVRPKAGAITPVPGGVGPMTIACLLVNTVFAYCDSKDLPRPESLSR